MPSVVKAMHITVVWAGCVSVDCILVEWNKTKQKISIDE